MTRNPCEMCERHSDPWFLLALIMISVTTGIIVGLGSGWLYWWR